AYAQFLNRSEASISLVVINGILCYGYIGLMEKFEEEKEEMTVGGTKYHLFLRQASADTAVGALSLNAAVDKLQDGLQRLPELAKNLNAPHIAELSIANAATHPQWFLVLDHNDEPDGEKLRLTAPGVPQLAAAPARPLSEIVEPLDLDIMTVAGDKDFLPLLQDQINLPQYVKDGLGKMYK
ncbi:MAG TPA: hypothetical protein VK588_02740, partial [Chitinophagaceae bacterium]|nr:hypothetical protein [Chitinophagaceae bacterium]